MTRIGRYEIEAEIGRGAMGVVYRARDTRLDRIVALKRYELDPRWSPGQQEEFRERFFREARAAGRLTHPGIVTIHDVDDDPESRVPYIAMEYVPGRSLSEVLAEDGAFEPEAAFKLAVQVATALHAAHEEGIVHRDIKPSNIMIHEKSGDAKLADFGVARIAESELTQTGMVPGSPSYMSPEQIRGKELDGRSDLFSLAAILYEMLCGERPFAGEDLSSLAYAIVHNKPRPLSERVEELGADHDRFFDAALSKDAGLRFANGQVFAEAASRLLATGAAVAIGDPAAAVDDVQEAALAGELDDELTPGSAFEEDEHAVPWERPQRGGRLRRAHLVAGLLLAVVLTGWWMWGDKGTARVRLEGKNHLPVGELLLSVDGNEVYRRALAAPVRNSRMMGRVKKAIGRAPEAFEASFELSAGRHEILAELRQAEGVPVLHNRLLVDLKDGETRRLIVVSGKHRGTPLILSAD